MKKGTKTTIIVISIISVLSVIFYFLKDKIIGSVLKNNSASSNDNKKDTEIKPYIPYSMPNASFPLSRGSKLKPYGSYGKEVKKLQEYLNFLQWFNSGKKDKGFIDTDGKFGKDTLNLISKFNLRPEIDTDYYDNVVLFNLKNAEKQYNRDFTDKRFY